MKPSKVFLWALEKEEMRAAGAAAASEKQYKTALQVYEVHASGLKLLHTFSEKDIKQDQRTTEDTWISKIFPVWLAIVCGFSLKSFLFHLIPVASQTPFPSG